MGYERNYRHVTTEAVAQVTMSKVYGWMCLALAVSAAAAYCTVKSPALLQLIYGNMLALFVLVFAELGLVMYLSARIASISFQSAVVMMGIYAALNGVMLSSVFLCFQSQIIGAAFLSTALTFGAMSTYGYVTKRDLSGIGSYLIMGLIGVIIATLVNFFLHSQTLDYIITYVGLFIFVGLTAYDTQKIRYMLQMTEGTPMDARKVGLMGALNLYLDFINIFLFILRLLGSRR